MVIFLLLFGLPVLTLSVTPSNVVSLWKNKISTIRSDIDHQHLLKQTHDYRCSLGQDFVPAISFTNLPAICFITTTVIVSDVRFVTIRDVHPFSSPPGLGCALEPHDGRRGGRRRGRRGGGRDVRAGRRSKLGSLSMEGMWGERGFMAWECFVFFWDDDVSQ